MRRSAAARAHVPAVSRHAIAPSDALGSPTHPVARVQKPVENAIRLAATVDGATTNTAKRP